MSLTSSSTSIQIPKVRRVTRLIPNQDGDHDHDHDHSSSDGVFQLTQRAVKEPRRIRKRQLVDAWKKSPLSRGLAETSLSSTIDFPFKSNAPSAAATTTAAALPALYKWQLTPNQLEPRPVEMLSPTKAMVLQHKTSAWAKYTDSRLLANSTREIVNKICSSSSFSTSAFSTSARVNVPQRQKRFASRIRLARIQPMSAVPITTSSSKNKNNNNNSEDSESSSWGSSSVSSFGRLC